MKGKHLIKHTNTDDEFTNMQAPQSLSCIEKLHLHQISEQIGMGKRTVLHRSYMNGRDVAGLAVTHTGIKNIRQKLKNNG